MPPKANRNTFRLLYAFFLFHHYNFMIGNGDSVNNKNEAKNVFARLTVECR